MPSGKMPEYAYRPSKKAGDPQLRTCSSLRARLWAGGTYFRARNPGALGNNLSVQVIEYSTSDAVCVITNHNIKADELVTGPATIDVFDLQLNTNEAVELYNLHSAPARARKYSISFKIAPDAPVYTDLGEVRTLSLVSLPGILAVKVTPAASVFTPTDVVSITPRKRVYRLVRKTVTVTDPMGSSTASGWDIDNLRAQVNANDPWVEMMPRSGPVSDGMGGPPLPNDNPADHQDVQPGVDDVFLSEFPETRLAGGDGIPDNPDRENTGPHRSLVHVNYGEAYNGRLTEVNIVYEWNGKSAREGAWQNY